MRLLAASLLLASLNSCPKVEFPPVPTPTPSPTASATATPTPSATPTATATPTPEPSPTVVPTATPSPTVVAECPVRPNRPRQCVFDPHSGEMYRGDFLRALDEAERLGLSVNGKIASEKIFIDGLATILNGYGYCAINGKRGGHTEEDEVWFYKDDSASFHYDAIAGPVGEKRVWNHFAALCTPALF